MIDGTQPRKPRPRAVMIGGGVGAGVGALLGAVAATQYGLGAVAPGVGGGVGALLGYFIGWAVSRRKHAEPGAAADGGGM